MKKLLAAAFGFSFTVAASFASAEEFSLDRLAPGAEQSSTVTSQFDQPLHPASQPSMVIPAAIEQLLAEQAAAEAANPAPPKQRSTIPPPVLNAAQN